MNLTKLALGTLIGGIVYFLMGWLIYGMVVPQFWTWPEGMQELVEYKPEEMKIHFIFLGCLVWAMTLTWIAIKTSDISISSVVTNSIILSILVSLNFGLSLCAQYKFAVMQNTFIDIVANIVCSTVAGASIGWFLSRKR